MKRAWFGPRVIGLGVSPSSWEGWLATLLFSIAFLGALTFFKATLVGWIVALAVFAVFLVVVNRTYSPDARTPF